MSTKRVLVVAPGETPWSSASETVRTPRPFICSKNNLDFTERMKIKHSRGLTSVPVAIMSTVTAMRGLVEVRNLANRSSGFSPVVR